MCILGAKNAKVLKDIEDQILEILASDGDILEDEAAIVTLKESAVTSADIKEKQAAGAETEKEIDEVRTGYKPVAASTQVLFFCIADLAAIEPTYQYSLKWFNTLFIKSIKDSEKGSGMEQRLQNLDEHFTFSLYQVRGQS